jgi:hypothetical protein
MASREPLRLLYDRLCVYDFLDVGIRFFLCLDDGRHAERCCRQEVEHNCCILLYIRLWININMQPSESNNRSRSSTVVSTSLSPPKRLTDWFSILFLFAAVISGMDAYKFWKSGTVRTKPEIYGQALSRASSPEGKDEWSLSTDDLHAAKGAYTSDVYQGWSHDNETEFMETETLEGPHPGRHVSCMSAKTIPYERDLTPSAMSPTVTETRYTGIFPPATANYSFSRE